jgi:hypothetical protein
MNEFWIFVGLRVNIYGFIHYTKYIPPAKNFAFCSNFFLTLQAWLKFQQHEVVIAIYYPSHISGAGCKFSGSVSYFEAFFSELSREKRLCSVTPRL